MTVRINDEVICNSGAAMKMFLGYLGMTSDNMWLGCVGGE